MERALCQSQSLIDARERSVSRGGADHELTEEFGDEGVVVRLAHERV